MAGRPLPQSDIDALVAKLQFYKYQVSFGSTVLGPLNSPPKVEADTETKDTVLYETGSDPLAQILSKNNAKITLEVNDVDMALSLMSSFKKGDNLMNTSSAGTLTFVPLTSNSSAKTLTFSRAFLQPGVQTNFAEGDDPNYITLNFIAKPDDTGANLFSFE